MMRRQIPRGPIRGRDDRSGLGEHEPVMQDVRLVRQPGQRRSGLAAREVLSRVNRHDGRRSSHARDARVCRRLRVKVQQIERAVAFGGGHAAPGEQSNVQFLAPPPEIQVPGDAGSRRERNAGQTPDDPVAEGQVAAQIDMGRVHRRDLLADVRRHLRRVDVRSGDDRRRRRFEDAEVAQEQESADEEDADDEGAEPGNGALRSARSRLLLAPFRAALGPGAHTLKCIGLILVR